jgi:hypothetical protein
MTLAPKSGARPSRANDLDEAAAAPAEAKPTTHITNASIALIRTTRA